VQWTAVAACDGRAGWARCAARACLLAAVLAGAPLPAPAQGTGPAAELRQRYESLKPQLANNAFGHPLHLESGQAGGVLRGEIHAAVDQPFATVSAALDEAGNWCDVLILHLNVKQCRASAGRAGGPGAVGERVLAVYLGAKRAQSAEGATRVEFAYRVAVANAEFLQVVLEAEKGPMGTRDYRIVFSAIPLQDRRAFVRLSYSYGYGAMAKVAMQAYLATMGRDKVGFTIVDRRPDGQPVYVDGVRGVVERNAMRYYLAVGAYLDNVAAPPAEQVERRLRAWFAATERYARQLHEVEENEYLDMKRREVERQRGG
jgi:hypothetical protein